jgi:phosphate transport system substrate-binding protein
MASFGLALGVAAGAQAAEITGAGATFPAPVYAKWAEAAKPGIGVTVNYQAIGSGGGQNQILSRTVDFGASDAPVDPAKLTSGNLVQFPTVIGGIVPIVNIPGVDADKLKLTGELLAQIYLGKIAYWNDPKITAINPDLKLPRLAIAPVYRADGSGTTYVFTSYLSKVNPDWKAAVGASTSVKWNAGTGAKGNDGVAAQVRGVRGALGYVEYTYAAETKLTTAELRNKSGAFIAPTSEAFAAAASAGDWKDAKDYAVDLNDEDGAASWPIVSATFLLVPRDAKDPSRTADVLRWVDWAYSHGAQIASDLHYIPLPAAVEDSVRATWKAELKGPDGKPLI